VDSSLDAVNKHVEANHTVPLANKFESNETATDWAAAFRTEATLKERSTIETSTAERSLMVPKLVEYTHMRTCSVMLVKSKG